MTAPSSPNYLAGYPATLTAPVYQLIERGLLAERLLKKYPQAHTIRADAALYTYVQTLKENHLRHAAPLSRISFDSRLQTLNNALGTHSRVARIQGGKLQSKREIRIASVFREMPEAFLGMIVAHELAHIKESEHNKAFYQLCAHLCPDYHQAEFDLRVYLTYLAAGGAPLWPARSTAKQAAA